MKFQLILKRVFDVLVSTVALVFLLPVFFVIALLIKIDSSGPVFFIQERQGQAARVFNIWKFRTMFHRGHQFSVSDIRGFESNGADPRITRVGYFLRKFGLDELPQLVNILKGEMSFVGPRPFYPPRYVANPDFLVRLVVKPGLTSLAVLHGGAKLPDKEMLAFDIDYIKERNLGLDIEILCKTFILYAKKIYETNKI